MRCLESWRLFVRYGLRCGSIPSQVNGGAQCRCNEGRALVSRWKCPLFGGLKSHTFDALEKPRKAYLNKESP